MGDSMPPTGNRTPVTTQEPFPGPTRRTKTSQISDFLQDSIRIGMLRTSYEKHPRYVTLNLVAMFNALVALYHSAIATHWRHLKWFMDAYPSLGVAAPLYAARIYISSWILDLYCSNRKAVKKLSSLAYSEHFDYDKSFYSYEYDSYLVQLNAAIRPTNIRGLAEDVLYIPIMHMAPQWESDNPFSIPNFVNNYDAAIGLMGILKQRKIWTFDTLVTDTFGRPSWLFDWHTDDRICAWFPMEGNYTMDDVSMAYILGADCSPKLGARDVDDWQDFPGGIVPATINVATLLRLTPRRFYGGYEVRTVETQLPTDDTTTAAQAKKKSKQARTQALPALSAGGYGEPSMGSTDTTMPDVSEATARFQLTDWTYYHLVVLNTDIHTRFGALKMYLEQ